jgi:hypothetical protein
MLLACEEVTFVGGSNNKQCITACGEEDDAQEERNERLELDALPHLEGLSANTIGCDLFESF